MILKNIIPILIITLLISCNGENALIDTNDFFQENEPKNLYTLVYIDLSRSQDTACVNHTTAKLVELYMSQPTDRTTQFVIRIIDKDHSVQPLFDEEIDKLIDTRKIELDKREMQKDLSAKLIKERVLFYYESEVPTKKSAGESCICNSLENAHVSLSTIDTSTTDIQLVVFSDMFEECGKNSSNIRHQFYFCSKNGKLRGYDELKQDIIANYQPSYPISKYIKPENLYFILVESDNYNENPSRCLNAVEVEELWVELFVKMGYDQDDIGNLNGISYTTDFPKRLLNKE